MASRDEMNRASEHLDRAGDHAGDAAHHTKEALEAGASGTLERTRETAHQAERAVERTADRAADKVEQTARNAGHVAERVSNAGTDRNLENRVDSATEGVLHAAGNVVQGAAPIVGRGAEAAVNLTGSALSAASGVLGTIVGKIAGRVGGWWNEAAKAVKEMPQEEREACHVHFTGYASRPASLTFEQALPGYALGYVAAENPSYRDRNFEDIETDLRHGFGPDETDRYDSLREFTRYGYERGTRRI